MTRHRPASTSLDLSEEQRTVIDHPLEPVRVAAGAGTGKTTTIVLRLQRAIDRHGIEPEEALGITFTNKAAEELAGRLRVELPDFAAEGREVEVTTYHGFAHRVLREFGALVGVERTATVIGPGYVRQLLLESIGDGPFSALDMTAGAQRANEAATLAAQLGDNLITAGVLIEAAPDARDDVWSRRIELAGIVERYAASKQRLGVVDYADLIAGAHRIVTEHPAVMRRIRERYRMVLLDEYQDTDPAQRSFLLALFGDGFPVTAVGDADQTIYEWRGASLDNFASFPAHFALPGGTPAATLPLTVNRRSDLLVLDAANAVKERLHGSARFDPLIAGPGTATGKVITGFFRTAVEEATWIAEEIRRLHDEEGVTWREMAVLFRKNRHIGLVREALSAEGVPLEIASLGGLLSVPEVTDLHAWLRILERPEDSAALIRILRFGRYRLGLGDLAILARWVGERGRAADRDDEEEPGWPLLEAIDRLEDVSDLRDEARRRLTQFRSVYRALLMQAQSASLAELCRRILDATEAWHEIDAMEPAAALSARLNIYRFLDLAEQWSPLQGRPSLEAFLGYLELLTDERSGEELDTASVGSEDAVSLITVHRAKGLEWDVVFLPALVRQTFPARSMGYDDPLQRHQSLPFQLRIDAGPEDEDPKTVRSFLEKRHLDQEWRTAYVAVTRARHRLIATGAYWYGSQTEAQPSELMTLIDAIDGSERARWVTEAGTAPERIAMPSAAGAPDPVFGEEGWRAAVLTALRDPAWPDGLSPGEDATYHSRMDQLRIMIDGLPEPAPPEETDEGFVTSVTGLVTLATCPKRFFWSEIDRLPRRPTLLRRHGVEVHRRIELHNRGVVPLEDLAPDLYDLDVDGESDEPTPGAYKAFLDSRFADTKPRWVEVPIDVKLGDARVRGRIDAIYEPEPGVWEIVDFKSGRPREDAAKRVQLQAYAIAAADGAVSTVTPESMMVTFAYLGGGEPVEESESVDDVWLETARNRLSDLLDQAAGSDFPTVASPACRHCDFLDFCPTGERRVAADRSR